uniref:Uncharacterized protein n=1 Tax=Molossus molossus TaxID=27622 RepID=A0A7J8I153_MOLMO|nr:hypothetical protein HJG59_010882 [Molossus molossus]
MFLLFYPIGTPLSIPPTPSPALLSMSIGYAYMHMFCGLSLPIPPPPFLRDVSLCPTSMFLGLPYSSDCYVHYIPYISEIMWYLSFSAWLISLRIILSRSLHVISRIKDLSFLQLDSTPLCICTTAFLSICLLMDTWAVSRS